MYSHSFTVVHPAVTKMFVFLGKGSNLLCLIIIFDLLQKAQK